jgi:hypothetical protein
VLDGKSNSATSRKRSEIKPATRRDRYNRLGLEIPRLSRTDIKIGAQIKMPHREARLGRSKKLCAIR